LTADAFGDTIGYFADVLVACDVCLFEIFWEGFSEGVERGNERREEE
jgi:hypothetical protein